MRILRKTIPVVVFKQAHSLVISLFLSLDCTRTPLALQEQIMKGILRSTGIESSNQVHIVKETDISFGSRERHHQVAWVGHKIISAARDYVQTQLQDAMNAVRAKLPPDTSEPDFLEQCEQDDTVQYWYDARLRLQGEDVQNKIWQYIFISSETPNAFVTEILPQRFFITTAMLNEHYWLKEIKVPEDRFNRRCDYIRNA